MLKFNLRFKDYALRACPKSLVRFSNDDNNETIEFVKIDSSDLMDRIYTIGYFVWDDNESCWELKFVGDRFCEIDTDDIKPVWKMLKAAYNVLTEWKVCENG